MLPDIPLFSENTMRKPQSSFHEGRNAFMDALYEYQSATLEMNLALQKITKNTRALYAPLKTVVLKSHSAIAPRHDATA